VQHNLVVFVIFAGLSLAHAIPGVVDGQLLVKTVIFSGKSKVAYENLQTIDIRTKILHFC